MAGIRFTLEQQKLLEMNPNIEKASAKSITYKDKLKLWVIEEYAKGKKPTKILREADMNPQMIGSENPGRCLNRWRKSYFAHGDSGLIGEKRG